MKRVMLALLVLAAVNGRAEEQATLPDGFSRPSCGTWLEARRSRDTVYSWLLYSALGRIIGTSMALAFRNPLQDVDNNGVAYWLDNWCQANPSGAFMDAVDAFIAAHRSR